MTSRQISNIICLVLILWYSLYWIYGAPGYYRSTELKILMFQTYSIYHKFCAEGSWSLLFHPHVQLVDL